MFEFHQSFTNLHREKMCSQAKKVKYDLTPYCPFSDLQESNQLTRDNSINGKRTRKPAKLSKYKILSLIGTGGYGKVFLVKKASSSSSSKENNNPTSTTTEEEEEDDNEDNKDDLKKSDKQQQQQQEEKKKSKKDGIYALKSNPKSINRKSTRLPKFRFGKTYIG